MAAADPIWQATAFVFGKIPEPFKGQLQPLLKWEVGVSPFSTLPTVLGAVVVYLITIFGIQSLMQNKEPLKFRPLFIVHNILLSAGSALLLANMVEELIPIVWRDGLFAGICADSSWTAKLETLYIFNYLFKYWELADTVFLAFKKKPLQFLHVFHHTATAVLCYTQLNGRTAVSWVPITINLTVHVIMYYYYFITTYSPGIKLWWKRYLTALQISQFLIDLVAIYFASYSYFANTYTNLPTMGSCAGTEGAAIFGCSIITSYLFLFIAFYQRTYKSEKKAKSAIKAARKTASGSGPAPSAGLPGTKSE